MNKKIVIYLSLSFCIGVLSTFLFFVYYLKIDVDFLVVHKNYPVVTKKNIVLVDNSKKSKIIVPEGTTLTFKSQYREQGLFFLSMFSSSLDSFEKTEKKHLYFEKEN